MLLFLVSVKLDTVLQYFVDQLRIAIQLFLVQNIYLLVQCLPNGFYKVIEFYTGNGGSNQKIYITSRLIIPKQNNKQ